MNETMMSIFNVLSALKMHAYVAVITLMIIFGGPILCTPENESEKHKIQKYWFISMILVLFQRVVCIVMNSTIDVYNPAEDIIGAVLLSVFTVMDILMAIMTAVYVIATIVLTIRYQIKKRRVIQKV